MNDRRGIGALGMDRIGQAGGGGGHVNLKSEQLKECIATIHLPNGRLQRAACSMQRVRCAECSVQCAACSAYSIRVGPAPSSTHPTTVYRQTPVSGCLTAREKS